MSATADPFNPAALPFRVATLERNEVTMADKLSRVDDKTQAHDVVLATQHEQIGSLTKAVVELKGAVTWSNRILIGLCVSITGSAVAAILAFHP